MSTNPIIRRRSLPGSLRWLADKLDADNVTEADRAGAAITLHALADEISLPLCAVAGDAPNSLGTERCELPAGHDGRHYEGNVTWPQTKRPTGSEEKTG